MELIFQVEVDKVNSLIERLKKVGIDVTGLKCKFRAILTEYNADNNYSLPTNDFGYIESVAVCANNDALYANGVKQLRDLQQDITLVYGPYFDIFNSNKVIQERLDQKEFTKEEVEALANEISKTIYTLNHLSTINNKKSLLETTYHIAYIIMKLELFYLKTSKIFTLSLEDEVVERYLNNEIKKDLKHTELTPSEKDRIQSQLIEIEARGLETSYVNYDLIMILVSHDQKLQIKEIKNHLLELKKQLKKAEKLEIAGKNFQTLFESTKLDLKRNRQKVVSRIAASGLTLTLLVGAGVVLLPFNNDLSTTHLYYTTTERYSTMWEQVDVREEYQQKLETATSTTIYEIEPYQQNPKKIEGYYVRNVLVYDASSVFYSSLQEYMALDLHVLGGTTETIEEEKDQLYPSDQYSNTIRDVIRITQDENNIQSNINERKKWFSLALEVFLLITLDLGLESLIKHKKNIMDFLNIRYILEAFRERDSNKKNLYRIWCLLNENQDERANLKLIEIQMATLYDQYSSMLSDDPDFQKKLRQ